MLFDCTTMTFTEEQWRTKKEKNHYHCGSGGKSYKKKKKKKNEELYGKTKKNKVSII